MHDMYRRLKTERWLAAGQGLVDSRTQSPFDFERDIF